MGRWTVAAIGGLLVAACGGGGGGSGSTPVTVVPAAPAPTATPSPTPAATPSPTPTATPAPTPSPTPTPSSNQPRFAELTGDQTFRSACAALVSNGSPPQPQPATALGDGLTLGYTAASTGYALAGDGVDIGFGPADAEATATAGTRSYARTVGGVVQRLSIVQPVAGTGTLDYVRSLSLRVSRGVGPTQYACVFGVPTLAAERPVAAIDYARVGIGGTAYVAGEGGGLSTYAIGASTGTVGFDPASGALTIRIRLVGQLQTASGTASTTTDLGTFTGRAVAADGSFGGQIDSADRVSLFSSFGGGFFGPQGVEAAMAFEILAADVAANSRMSVVGTVVAVR